MRTVEADGAMSPGGIREFNIPRRTVGMDVLLREVVFIRDSEVVVEHLGQSFDTRSRY
jgi:hypothetical protein